MNGRDILAKAISHIGENGNPTWKAYGGGTGWAWCCAFVWRVFKECGLSELFYGGGKTAYVPTADNWLYNGGGEWITYNEAQAGDIVVFTWHPKGSGNTRSGSRDHIGIFEQRISSTQFSCIEGNTGSPAQVRRRTRGRSNIFAIYRPKYASKKMLKVDGKWGTKTTRALQKYLGTAQDGYILSQSKSNKKYLQNCQTSSWKFVSKPTGSKTIKALQRKLRVSEDGIAGKVTIKALQKFLGVKVDGYRGKNTVKALQTWLNKQ